MIRIIQHVALRESEIWFTYSTSSGPGGQNVNKVATRATLHFRPNESESLTPAQRARIMAALGSRLDQDGTLRIVAGRHRTQAGNRNDALARLVDLLAAALKPRTPRKKTRPTAASKQRRLTAKRIRGERKSARRPPRADEG